MQDKHLLILTLSAVITGLSLGLILRQFEISEDSQSLVSFPGEIFMQVLKLMILPLIFSSLISSLGQMDAEGSGKMGLIAVLYYMSTVTIACAVGVTVVTIIHPGDPNVKMELFNDEVGDPNLTALDSVMDLIRNMFPENIIEATMKRSQTQMVAVRRNVIKNGTGVVLKKMVKLSDGTNILGLIVFCTGFGIIISKFGQKGKIVVDFFIVLDKVVMRFIDILMWFAPIGIISLISSSILEIDDLSVMITTMALYVVTVMICLFIHCVLIIPTIYFLLTRKHPLNVAKGMVQPFVTALGTASSGASLPQAIHSVENNLNVDNRIAGFIMPLGNTINMDGNALYEAVAVIFIAQLNNITLSMADIITICVTATFASIGLNAVPAGLVSMFVILSAVGLPVTDIPLLFTVDWLIDRVRTALNVLGDSYCASIVHHFMKDELLINKHVSLDTDINDKDDNNVDETDRPDQLEMGATKEKRVSFAEYHHIPSPSVPIVFNSVKTYSLKSAIIEPLRAHVALSTRLSQLSEE